MQRVFVKPSLGEAGANVTVADFSVLIFHSCFSIVMHHLSDPIYCCDLFPCGVILDCTLIWCFDMFVEFCKGSHIPGKDCLLGIPLYLWDTLVEIHSELLN